MRDRTPTYRIELQTTGTNSVSDPMEWPTRQAGRPTAVNVERFLAVHNGAMEPGGCNAHLRERDPEFSYTGARVVRQRDARVVASHGWTELD